jgi:hypothetical protein
MVPASRRSLASTSRDSWDVFPGSSLDASISFSRLAIDLPNAGTLFQVGTHFLLDIH